MNTILGNKCNNGIRVTITEENDHFVVRVTGEESFVTKSPTIAWDKFDELCSLYSVL